MAGTIAGMPGPGSLGPMNDPQALYQASLASLKRGELAKAIQLADRLLTVTRWAPQACAWAANLRLESREWQQAIAIAETGLAKGRSAALFGIVGQAELARSNFSQAESAFREAISEQPGYAPWLFNLARVHLRQDRDFEAMELLRQGVSIAPDAICLIRLAQLELSFGDPGAALDAAIRGLALAPGDASGHVLAARSLLELGRDEEADTHWRQASVAAAPNPEEVELARIGALRENGQFDRAIPAIKAVVESHPSNVKALALLAESSRCTDSDRPQIAAMESLAAKDTTSPGSRMNLEFAIGKAFDDLGSYQEAMLHFDRANAIGYQAIAARGGFDSKSYSASIQARIETFSPKAFEQVALTGIAEESPIFVVGMIRSGTTLLEQILGRHPLVRGIGEQKFWISLDEKLIDLAARRIRYEALSEAASVYVRLMNRYRNSRRHVVDKQPGNLLVAGLLHMAFPNARILYMHRDPLDNAISIWNTNVQTSVPFVHHKGNLASAMRQHETLRRHWQDVLPSNRFLTVPYEALVTEQSKWTTKILEFCALPWSDACLTPEKGNNRVTTPSLWQVRQPVYRTSVGRWKNYEPWLGELRGLL